MYLQVCNVCIDFNWHIHNKSSNKNNKKSSAAIEAIYEIQWLQNGKINIKYWFCRFFSIEFSFYFFLKCPIAHWANHYY